MIFLRCQGKIRDAEKELGISYPTVIKRLDLVNVLLGNQSAPSGRNNSSAARSPYKKPPNCSKRAKPP
jgi:hypothetical protein